MSSMLRGSGRLGASRGRQNLRGGLSLGKAHRNSTSCAVHRGSEMDLCGIGIDSSSEEEPSSEELSSEELPALDMTQTVGEEGALVISEIGGHRAGQQDSANRAHIASRQSQQRCFASHIRYAASLRGNTCSIPIMTSQRTMDLILNNTSPLILPNNRDKQDAVIDLETPRVASPQLPRQSPHDPPIKPWHRQFLVQ
jgi:hypothetical protein